ncbi:MAG: bifunctional oligoribonuclease/PAP phosphatase NrnA [Candidatus Marinimicrobia bacterium]|nr:bifunctional oligoribonuclease/PAP phosphatase NrnA [Candidatus Neomarinimicrobiota bacterium]RKY57596.1 MAG: hypothetical protein DRP96_09710 [Candidatus Neomarinimicrobiota bacterium]
MHNNWKPIIQLIQKAEYILLTTHVNPDGDGIGSELAMYRVFKKMNIRAEIINSSPLPDEYSFLDKDNVIRQYNPEQDGARLGKFDLVIIFDVGGVTRTGILGDDLTRHNIPCICIDHHPENHIVCDEKIVDSKAPATTCIVLELIREIGDYIDYDIAEAIYVGLMTDTGSFRFENTTRNTFRVAADLLEYGIKPNEIYNRIYESYTPARMSMLGTVLKSIRYESDGRLAWFKITQSDLKNEGASIDEIGGFTDFVRSIKGVEVSVMFLEVREGQTRVNFRSKGRVIVNEIARKFGGGGHYYAAGLTLHKPIAETIELVLPELRKTITKIDI